MVSRLSHLMAVAVEGRRQRGEVGTWLRDLHIEWQ
jgi:hypothetical protein